MTSRLEQLLRYAEEDPHDPFNIYAVAYEYSKAGSDKAEAFFETLVRDHPSYVPTYYTYGKWLQERGHTDKAREVFLRGKATAQSVNDLKATRELGNAINELDFDY